MAWPVSLSSGVASITIQSPLEEPNLSLDAIRQARGDINEIRMLLKGNTEECLRLFKQAVDEGDVISQIELSQALHGLRWGEDEKRDFSSVEKRDLEEFSYYPQGLNIFNQAYFEAMKAKSTTQEKKMRARSAFRAAADLGYLPAFLEIVTEDWGWRKDTYGFAVQLRPFVSKGYKQLDYCFGLALKKGCVPASPLYYEGLYWMHQSLGIKVKYPDKDQTFEDLRNNYDFFKPIDLDGFSYLDDEILAPSRAAWESFVKTKLEKVRVASQESYRFSYDPKQINSLLKKYNIGLTGKPCFVNSCTNEDVREKPIYGFQIGSLTLYENRKPIGTISVRKDTLAIYETFKNPVLQPLIHFIETVLKRTGSTASVCRWLDRIREYV